eukprot:jgi/Mesvir1/5920/Mv00688-RA.2
MDGARAADLASGDAIRVSGALLQILQAASGGRDMSNFADLVFRKVVVGASSTGNNDTWLSCKRLAYDVLRCSRLRPQLWTKLESTLPGDMANGPPDLRMAALGMAIHVPEARVGEFLRSAARELTICTGPDSPSTVRRAAVVTLSRLLMKEDFLALCENSPWAAETIRSWWGTIAAATLDPDASISEASFTALGDLFSSIDPALSSPSPAARLRDPQARYVCQHLASRLAHSLWFKLDTLLRRADALPLTGRRATAYPLTFLVRAAAAGILGDILSRTPPHPASSSSTSSTSSKGQQSMIERTAHGSSSSLSRSQDRFFHTPAALGKLSRAVSDVASQLAPLLSSLQPSAVHEAAACLLAIASLPGAPVDLGLAAASALLSLWERRDVASGGREAVLSSLARGATSLPPGRQPPLLRRLLLLATHPGAPKSDRPNVLAHVARAAMELRMAACVAVRAGETPPAGTELKDVYGEIVASLQLLRPGLPQQLEPSSASDGPSAVAADGTPLAARARGGAGAGTGSGTGGGGSIISPSYPPPVREELLACLCETAERLMEPPGSLGLRGGANNGVDGGGGGGGEGYGGSGAPPGGMLSAAVLLGGMGYSRRRPAVPYVSAHALVPWPLQGSALRGHLAGRPRADWADAWVLSALELLEAWAPCLAWETAGRVYAIDCYLRLASVLCGAVGVRGAGMGSSSPSPGGSSSMIGSSSTTALNSSGGNAATATSFAWERRAMAGAIGPLLRAAPGALRCDAAMAEACEHAWQVAAAARQGGPLYKRMFGLFALCGDYPFPRAAGRVPVATLAGGVQAGGGLSQEPSPLQDMQLSRRIGESLEVAWRDTRGPSLPSSAAVDGEPLCVSGPSDPCHVTITHSCDSASKAVQITVKVFNILDFELKYVSLRIGTVGPLVFAQHACQPSHVTHLPPLLPQDSFTTTFSFRVLAFQASTIFLQVIHRSTPPPLEEGDDSDAAGDNDANGMIDDSPLLNADASPSLGPTSSMPSLPGATSVVLHHCLPYPIPLAQLVEPLACSQEDFFRRWESFPAAISFSLAGLLSGPPTHGDIRSGPPGAAGAGATGSLGEPQGAWLAPIGPDSLRSSGGLLAPAGSATMGSTRRSGGGRLSGSVDVLARSSADRLYWEKGGWGGGAVAPRSSSSWSHRSRRATWRSWARTRSSRRVASRCASSAGPGSVTRSGWSWLATWQVTLERPCPSMPRFPSPPPRRPLRVWLRCQSPGSASSVKRSSGRPQRAQCRRCASSPRCGSRISLGA